MYHPPGTSCLLLHQSGWLLMRAPLPCFVPGGWLCDLSQSLRWFGAGGTAVSSFSRWGEGVGLEAVPLISSHQLPSPVGDRWDSSSTYGKSHRQNIRHRKQACLDFIGFCFVCLQCSSLLHNSVYMITANLEIEVNIYANIFWSPLSKVKLLKVRNSPQILSSLKCGKETQEPFGGVFQSLSFQVECPLRGAIALTSPLGAVARRAAQRLPVLVHHLSDKSSSMLLTQGC